MDRGNGRRWNWTVERSATYPVPWELQALPIYSIEWIKTVAGTVIETGVF